MDNDLKECYGQLAQPLMSVEEQRFDGRRVKRVATFWENNKSWLVPVISVVAGGGLTNADRLSTVAPSYVPASSAYVQELEERVAKLEEDKDNFVMPLPPPPLIRDYDRSTE